MQDNLLKELKEWFKAIIISLSIVLVIKSFIFNVITISGTSMKPTLNDGDRVFVNIVSSRLINPDRQDIIIFTPSIEKESFYIKRVIGIAGDLIIIKDGKVYLNGNILDESYLPQGTVTEGDLTLRVPPGTVFVLGDNRQSSEDSRDIRLGPIPIKSIKGTAAYKILPIRNFKKL